jgi:hypothetical protein
MPKNKEICFFCGKPNFSLQIINNELVCESCEDNCVECKKKDNIIQELRFIERIVEIEKIGIEGKKSDPNLFEAFLESMREYERKIKEKNEIIDGFKDLIYNIEKSYNFKIDKQIEEKDNKQLEDFKEVIDVMNKYLKNYTEFEISNTNFKIKYWNSFTTEIPRLIKKFKNENRKIDL